MDGNGRQEQHPTTSSNAHPRAPKPIRLPRGIRLITRSDRPERRFGVQWRVESRRNAKWFAIKSDQLAFAKNLACNVTNIGVAAYQLNPDEARQWRAFLALVAPATLDEVYACYSRFGDRSRSAMLVGDAGKRFLELRKALNLSADSISHVRLHLDRFSASFGSKALADVTATQIRAWLAALTDPGTGEPMGQKTRIHHLRTVKLFLKTAVAEKWTNDNPASAILLPKDDAEDVTVLSVEDARKLFAANRDALCIGRLALEAFGGLRFTSAARLKRVDFDRAELGIVMPGKKHKTGKRHYVDGYPDNLWAWINHAPDACWDLHPRMYAALKREAFERAGLKPVAPADGKAWNAAEKAQFKAMGNVLRHSFCSYHIAVHKDAARTAVLLTHSSPSMLYQFYKGRATQTAGNDYLSIVP